MLILIITPLLLRYCRNFGAMPLAMLLRRRLLRWLLLSDDTLPPYSDIFHTPFAKILHFRQQRGVNISFAADAELPCH